MELPPGDFALVRAAAGEETESALLCLAGSGAGGQAEGGDRGTKHVFFEESPELEIYPSIVDGIIDGVKTKVHVTGQSGKPNMKLKLLAEWVSKQEGCS
jgi:hypothetical protein